MKKRIRLTAPQANRMRSLLHMWYTPQELANEIGVSVQWVRRHALPAGCPHRRDETNHIWIDGQAFAQWAKSVIKPRRGRHVLGPGQAWCMKCARPVDMVGQLDTRPINAKVEVIIATCALCGCNVSRTQARDDKPG